MPIEFQLQYRGGGSFQTATKFDWEAADKELGAGEVVRATIIRRRSVRQNAMLHAIIENAWECQQEGPRFDNADQLRSYLFVQAGHCDMEQINLASVPRRDVEGIVAGIVGSLRRRVNFISYEYDRISQVLTLKFPRPWRFSKTDPETATEVLDRVISIICTKIVPGTDPASLRDHAKARAA